jgi:hypothetical protein
MFENQSQQSELPISTARIVIAVVLIALAVPLGIWVLTIVNSSINDTKTPAILQKINSSVANPVYINTPAGRTELPPQLFTVLSYMVLVFFLMIPTSIAIALLKGGVSLLNPDPTRQLRRFIDSLRKSIPPKQ